MIYLYADGLIQWTSGDGSNNATVGFSSRDSLNFFNVPQSGTEAIINITQTSNVNIPGVWMFRVSGKGNLIQIILLQDLISTFVHNTCTLFIVINIS